MCPLISVLQSSCAICILACLPAEFPLRMLALMTTSISLTKEIEAMQTCPCWSLVFCQVQSEGQSVSNQNWMWNGAPVVESMTRSHKTAVIWFAHASWSKVLYSPGCRNCFLDRLWGYEAHCHSSIHPHFRPHYQLVTFSGRW